MLFALAAPMLAVPSTAQAQNNLPTGELAIIGQPIFGATVTLDYSAIMDANGLPDLSQADISWIHVGNSSTQASNTTTYTLTTKDVGEALRVEMEYEDNGSEKETLELSRWPVSGTIAAIAPGAPINLTATASGTTQIDLSWFTPASSGGSPITGHKIEVSSDGGTIFTDQEANTNSNNNNNTYAHTGLPPGATRHYRVSAINAAGTGLPSNIANATTGTATNTAPTGAPTITGTAQVGQTLTAVTTAIMDANGLTTVSYTFQWIQVDGGTETNISGATASTYTLMAADEGKTIKVKVSFTDDANNAETLTSVATAAVSAARPPIVSISSLSTREDIGRVEVPVTLSWPSQVSLSVPWSTDDGTAMSPDDYADGEGALTFAPGVTEATISIRIVDDAVVEEVDEFFLVLLEPGDGYIRDNNSGVSATVAILDNDGNGLVPSLATVSGTTLVVTYEEVLGSASDPVPPHFFVTADGTLVDVDQVSVIGSMVTLTLATPIQAGQTVTLGYASNASGGGAPILDMEGNAVVSFSEWLVRNTSGGDDGASPPPPVDGVGGTEPPGGGGSGGGDPAATAPGAPESLIATAGDAEVVLEWTAPASSGGLAVSRYEVRHAAGSSVPADTLWQSAGLDLDRTIADLTNGQPYAFEVRAVNGVGPGAAATAMATPLDVPLAPESLTATAGDAQVVLAWSAPAHEGGAPIDRYEYRYAAGETVPEDTSWQVAGTALTVTVAELENEVRYVFEIRAVNRVGPGPAATAMATPLDVPLAPESLTATAGDAQVVLAWSAPAHEGGAPIDRYEYRYAAGETVPEDTSWQVAGTALTVTVAELENEVRYVFEIRAVNRVGPGPAATAMATPLDVPLAPESLTATAGDAQVVLAWSAPAHEGGAPIDRYEYRYAAGETVPEDTSWQVAGTALTVTVAELENEVRYVFEIRAVNRVGPGPAATAMATPLDVPLAPESLTATAGDAQVVLAWSAPAHEGGAPIDRYEYRYAAGETVPEDTSWQVAGTALTVTVAELENEVRYVFEIRAVNRVGPGPAASTSSTVAMLIRLRARLFAAVMTATEGEVLAVGVRRSGGLEYAAHAYVGVTDSAAPEVSAMDTGRDDGLGRQRLEFAAGEAESTIAITPAFDGQRPAERTLTVMLEAAEVEIDGSRLSYEPEVATLNFSVTDGEASVSVADAHAEPGAVALRFRVSLDRTRDVPVLVDYATADGTATAGQDYTAVSGTLTLEPGRREAEVAVPVLAAPHMTGERMLRLTLSHPRNALIADGEATGAIARGSDVPQAWLARFGRTAAGHVVDGVQARLSAPRNPGMEASLAGLSIRGRTFEALPEQYGAIHTHGGAAGRDGLESFSHWMANGPDDTGSVGLMAGRMTAHNLMTGSAFALNAAIAGGGSVAVWGRGAFSGFSGQDSDVALDGEVATAMLGTDYAAGRWIGGLSLSLSEGDGTYRLDGREGALESSMTGLYPYVGYDITDRLSAWGVAGYGRGDMTLTLPDTTDAISTDIGLTMAAMGARGDLVPRTAAAGFSLALTSDVLMVSTTSDVGAGLAASDADVSRLRLGLDGSWLVQFDGGASITPSFEFGMRRDGGDAETGFGVDIGGGLAFANAQSGFGFELNARGLLAHEDNDFREWGVSGAFRFDPNPSSELGLSLSLGPSWGASSMGGVNALLGRETMAGVALDGATPQGGRLGTEAAWGFPAFGGRYTGTPYLGLGLTEVGRDYRFGWRLGAVDIEALELALGLEGTRRESDGRSPEHGAMLLSSLRW